MNRPNYGLDAPDVVRRFLLLGGVMVVAGIVMIFIGAEVPLAR